MPSPDLQRLIILAAGSGTRLGDSARGKPKAAVELAGRPLISWQIDAALRAGFEDIIVVRGYAADRLPAFPPQVRCVDNPDFARTNMVYSLYLTRDLWADGFALSYADIVYSPSAIELAWESAGRSASGVAVAVDLGWRSYWEARFEDPLTDAETLRLGEGRILEIGNKPASLAEIQGQYTGLTCWRGEGVRALARLLDDAARAHARGETPLHPERGFLRACMTDVLQRLIESGTRLSPALIDGGWLEIDTPTDLALAESLVTTSLATPTQRFLEILR